MEDEVIILHGAKKKALLLLLASSAFVAMGTLMILDGKNGGWAVSAFFGLGVAISLYMLTPNAIRLTIDRHGIEMKSVFKPMKLAWDDVDGFYVGQIRTRYSTTELIGITFSQSYKKLQAGRRVSTALTGMEGALPNHFSRSGADLCDLLNKSKQRWGGHAQPGIQPDGPASGRSAV